MGKYSRVNLGQKKLLFIGLVLFFLFLCAAPGLADTELPITAAQASSSYSATYAPAKAIDNNLLTHWAGGKSKTTWWLGLDLSSSKALSKISIYWQLGYCSSNYSIRASNDRVNWVNLYTNLSSLGGTTNPVQKDYSLTGSYRYILIVISNAQNRVPVISEVKLFAPDANQPPSITSVTPETGETFLAGAQIPIQITATDPDNDPLEYRFWVGGSVKQAWSSLNTYTWQTTSSDTGSIGITCQARDNKGGLDSENLTYSIINPTAQEVLQKVADNYALVFDLTADAVFTSTLNGEPFGNTDYCRYYFKASMKEKIESFSEASRTTKVEITITDSSTMYLIDPIRRITQAVDLLPEAGITGSQFNQMNIYYDLPNFLSSHTVTKNGALTDFANKIIALDAIPVAQNSLYSKLELYVDYNKGILTKARLFKEDESHQLQLLQTLEATETQQMPNSAWVPAKMDKKSPLTSGELINTLDYDNLRINVGLTDADFDPTNQY
ncbi:MAG: discoidin domain-containing protein [Candidatus Omnitrophota bacterium]